jgi:hypothetical protein
MTKPLELVGGKPQDTHRVHFNNTGMKTHQLTAKLQAFSIDPLVTQIVVDAVSDLAVTGREELAESGKPIAYLKFGAENQTDAMKLVVLTFADYLIIAMNGRMTSTEALALEVQSLAKQLSNEIAYATFSALEKLAEAREGILEAV